MKARQCTVQIRGVTTGLPNDVVFAEKVVAPSEINLSGETKIVFDDPFYANANTSYAVVLLTNSTNYMVRTATLGRMGRNGIITRQSAVADLRRSALTAESSSAKGEAKSVGHVRELCMSFVYRRGAIRRHLDARRSVHRSEYRRVLRDP